jgi:NADPH-dependent curcumin reductase CurA
LARFDHHGADLNAALDAACPGIDVYFQNVSGAVRAVFPPPAAISAAWSCAA